MPPQQRISTLPDSSRKSVVLTSECQTSNSNITIAAANDSQVHRIQLRVDILPSVASSSVGDLTVFGHLDLVQLVKVNRDAARNVRCSLERRMATTLHSEWTAIFADLLYRHRNIFGAGWSKPTLWLGVCLLLRPVILLQCIHSLAFVRHQQRKLCIET